MRKTAKNVAGVTEMLLTDHFSSVQNRDILSPKCRWDVAEMSRTVRFSSGESQDIFVAGMSLAPPDSLKFRICDI